MEKLKLIIIIIMTISSLSEIVSAENYTSYTNTNTKSLSRRKRFLLFPDGSSFQLVFCVQTAALITIGDIFLYGNTAALAWSLPSDPKFFYMLKGYDKEAMRRGDVTNSIYYVDEAGKLIAKAPYKRKQFINPAFAKRSIDEEKSFKQKLKSKIDRLKMHERHKDRDYLNKDLMDNDNKEFHRNSRLELLQKIEKLLEALGQDGRQCVLYKLCEAGRVAPQQGTFLGEMFRVIFTLPQHPFNNDEHIEYDKAHGSTGECEVLYPGCDNFGPNADF